MRSPCRGGAIGSGGEAREDFVVTFCRVGRRADPPRPTALLNLAKKKLVKSLRRGKRQCRRIRRRTAPGTSAVR